MCREVADERRRAERKLLVIDREKEADELGRVTNCGKINGESTYELVSETRRPRAVSYGYQVAQRPPWADSGVTLMCLPGRLSVRGVHYLVVKVVS